LEREIEARRSFVLLVPPLSLKTKNTRPSKTKTTPSPQTFVLPLFLPYCPFPHPYKQELGVTILEDLARQRDTILHARGALHGADDGIARARKLLSTMSRRIATNRLLMGGIVATLLGAIILLITVKLRRH
jgi:hypothetical protein